MITINSMSITFPKLFALQIAMITAVFLVLNVSFAVCFGVVKVKLGYENDHCHNHRNKTAKNRKCTYHLFLNGGHDSFHLFIAFFPIYSTAIVRYANVIHLLLIGFADGF